MTTRRFALVGGLLLVGFLHPITGGAQPAARVPRIGYVSTNLTANPSVTDAFRQGLRDLGYVEGRSMATSSDSPRWLRSWSPSRSMSSLRPTP